MMRKMNSLITASLLNKNARANCEKCFNELKELVEVDVRSICYDGDEYDKKKNSSKDVLNPPGSRQKGIQSKRFKSIVEKQDDEVKHKKLKKLSVNEVYFLKIAYELCFLNLWIGVLYVNF